MEPAERVRTYTALAESTRKWASVMDTKAGFLSAINGALLTFMWVGARLTGVVPAAQWLAVAASLCSLLALLAALWIIIPRDSIGRRSGAKDEYRPISFYGYVATRYADADYHQFGTELAGFDEADFSREALEEHFTVSRIVKEKAAWVSVSGALTLVSMGLAGIALLVKSVYA